MLLQRRAPEWEHLGVLGPMLRGVVGDTLLVTFKNKLPDNAVSMHSHGMLYEKDSEGSPYYDGLPRESDIHCGHVSRHASDCTMTRSSCASLA